MAYGLSHRIEWKDREGVDSKIEILENDFAGAVTDCVPAEDPLLIDIAPMDPTIFIPVVGKGATINLVSATNGQFMGMYTLDPVKRMIKCFKNGNASAWFLGFINVEQYGEEYSRLTGYDVTIHCNDGFNALSRFKYLNGTSKYDTLETMWTVLTRILARTGLPYQYIYFASKISCTGITPAANETIWHNLKVDQNNYYDEQDEPMTHRAVLEELLKVKGLQIRQECGSIYIYEPQMLADASFSAKRFNGTTYAYVDTVNVSRNFDLSDGDTDWEDEDSLIDIKSGYSRQKIRYSPYMPQGGALEELDFSDRDKWTGTETWTPTASGIERLTGITAVEGMFLTYASNFGGHRLRWAVDDDGIYGPGEEELYLKQEFDLTGVLAIIPGNIIVGQKSDQFLLFECDVYIHSKANGENSDDVSVMARALKVPFTVQINSKGPVRDPVTGFYSWTAGSGDDLYAQMRTSNYSESVCDKWIHVKQAIPWNIPGGNVYLSVKTPIVYEGFGTTELDSTDGILSKRIRNVKVSILTNADNTEGGIVSNVNKADEVNEEDGEYKGVLNVDFQNEAPEITLFHSDARNISDRGAIRDNNGNFTTGWRKTGDTSDYKLPHLLLRSIISQYQDSNITLSGTMEADALIDINGGPNFLHTVQDTDQPQCGTKKLMFTGGQYSDFNRTINGTWEEIRVENLTIAVA